MTSPTIEIDLGSALERIEQSLADFRQETNQKLDNLNKEVTDLKEREVRVRRAFCLSSATMILNLRFQMCFNSDTEDGSIQKIEV